MKSIKERLEEIRNDSSWWKAAKISGADAYQGLPPFLRVIDEILEEFKSGKVLISVKEYDKMQEQIEWLECLERAGIDNSEAYHYACGLWNKRHKKEDE